MTPESWIAHDPDPQTAAELAALDPDELAARFARPLTFGTAGLRGPVRGGPDAMNLAVVLRATWALAQVLRQSGRDGLAIVGRDARHGSAAFATAAAEVLAAEGFSVRLLPEPVPTPVTAFAARKYRAAAGVQITASHNPKTDNGYKVYVDGKQIVPPMDREIESAMADAPPADQLARKTVEPSGSWWVAEYVDDACWLRHYSGPVRVALTPMHGVGGAIAVETLGRAGFDDIHTVATQFAPDPDFPTVAFPNPEEPGAADALLALAARVDADVAIALDPDADRCAVGIPTAAGWRMLSGDETGWLLGGYILASERDNDERDPPTPVVASTVVSSRMLAAIADYYEAIHVETLTGFKWLARADEDVAGRLVYGYEEAIGHCVRPDIVRDKDGITAAVAMCALVSMLKRRGSSVPEVLDDLAQRHGVHDVAAVSRRVADADEAAALMRRLRTAPPDNVAGFTVSTTDVADVLILTGGEDDISIRVAVRPSGTEPKVKFYTEVRCAVTDDLAAARAQAAALRAQLIAEIDSW